MATTLRFLFRFLGVDANRHEDSDLAARVEIGGCRSSADPVRASRVRSGAMTAAHVVSAGPRGPAPAADAPASVEPRRRRTRARPTRGLRPLEGSPEYLGSVPLVAVATWVLGVVVGYIVGVRRGRKQRDNASTSRYAHASTRTLHLDFPNPRRPTPRADPPSSPPTPAARRTLPRRPPRPRRPHRSGDAPPRPSNRPMPDAPSRCPRCPASATTPRARP